MTVADRQSELTVTALAERVAGIESRLTPQWGVYFAGLALVFSILTAGFALAMLPMQTQIAQLEKTEPDLMRTDVFKVSQERVFDAVNRLEKDLSALDAQFSVIAPATLALDDIKKRLDRIEGLRLSDPDTKGTPR